MAVRTWFDDLKQRMSLAPNRRQRQSRRVNYSAARPLRLEPLENRCMFSFNAATSIPVGVDPQAVVAADFNNDGRLDLAVANASDNSVGVLLGNGNGTFQTAQNSDTGTNPVSIAVGDFNRDSKLDLVAANGDDLTVSLLLGNGNGTFQARTGIRFSAYLTYPTSVAVGDFNADGKLDLGVVSNDYVPTSDYPHFGFASVLLGMGDGSFSAPVDNRQTYGYHTSGVVADFNGDGKDDMAVTNPEYLEVRVLPSYGNGNLNWNAGWWGVTAGYPTSSAAGDVNGDGKFDVVVANKYPSSVSVLLGNGVNGYVNRYAQSYATGGDPTSVALGDFNRDGLPDIATANSADNNVSILRGNGQGNFAAAENFAVGLAAATVTAGDFNDDGVVNGADYVTWRMHNGTADEFSAWLASFGESTGPSASAVATGDFDGDGWLDIATANASRNSVSVLINDRVWSGQSTPQLRINDVTVTEGNTGTVAAVFTVTLPAAIGQPITVGYSTGNGIATASDYTAASGTLTFAPGETTKTIAVLVKGDRIGEANESFLVNLTNPTNATIADGQGVGTIADNEPRISISDMTKAEGMKGKTTLFTFTVTLSAAYDQPVTISFHTANGTAKSSNSDYVAKTGTLTFALGETTKTITIEVKGDSKREGHETLYLDLFGNSSNSLFAKSRGIGTILNDD